MLRFVHEFEDGSPLAELSVSQELPEGAIAGIRVDQKAVLLYANSEGFLHLARIFAELGTRNLEERYHLHFGPDFEVNGAGPDEVELTIMHSERRLPLDEKRAGGAA